jgi:C4-dicarboxylate-specific signal transduction histidine kinase
MQLELKRLQTQLIAARLAEGVAQSRLEIARRMARDVANAINNPLAALGGNVETAVALLAEVGEPGRDASRLAEIAREGGVVLQDVREAVGRISRLLRELGRVATAEPDDPVS